MKYWIKTISGMVLATASVATFVGLFGAMVASVILGEDIVRKHTIHFIAASNLMALVSVIVVLALNGLLALLGYLLGEDK